MPHTAKEEQLLQDIILYINSRHKALEKEQSIHHVDSIRYALYAARITEIKRIKHTLTYWT